MLRSSVSERRLLPAAAAVAYVLFLGSVFHGPAHCQANQDEFGFRRFTFIAGLLFAAAHGPGTVLVMSRLRR